MEKSLTFKMVTRIKGKKVNLIFALFSIIFLIFISSGVFALSSITITSPNGGEYLSGTESITWSSTNCSSGTDYLNIQYTTDGATYSPVATLLDCSSGTYSWNTASRTDGSNYNLRITLEGNIGINNLTAASFTIDNTAPTKISNLVSSSHSISVYSQDNTIDFTWTDAIDSLSGLDGYSILVDTNSDTLPSQIKNVEEGVQSFTTATLDDGNSYYFHVRSIDNAGNWDNEAEHIGHFIIDTTKPTTADDYNTKDNVWVNSDQTITLIPADNLGVASTKYCLTSGCVVSSGTDYSSSISFTAEGTNYLRYASTDNAGNVQDTQEVIVKIDKTNPITSIDSPSSDSVIVGDLTFSSSATDTNLDSSACKYQIDSGSLQTIDCAGGSVSISSLEGLHTLTFYAYDLAGNSHSSSIDFIANNDQTLTVAPSGADFTSIQDAIDAATARDTISVGAGTYVESLIVNKPITLSGAGETTIIQPSINIDGIYVTANDVTIENLKVVTSNSGISPNIAVRVEETNNLKISGVTILTTGNKAMGIWVGGSSNGLNPSSNLKIFGSSITITDEATGIYAAHSSSVHSGWLIGGSEENSNYIYAPLGNPLELYDVSGSEVSYNDIETSSSGGSAVIWSAELADISNLIFDNNLIDYSGGSQVAFITDFIPGDTFDASASTITVQGNTFTNWGSRALRVGNGVTSVTVTENKFLSSGEDLMNEDAGKVNATFNYWGCPTGPGTSGCGTTSGTGTIDYTPWAWNENMDVDTTAPTVVLSNDHDDSIVRDADTVVITATFNETESGINEGIVPTISIGTFLIKNNMIKTNNTLWTYSWDVPADNDDAQIISISATDVAGNALGTVTGVTSLTIDNIAPTIADVTDITEEATSSSGAIATFIIPTSHDAVDGDLASSCDKTSGDTFAIGVTTVTCSKTDVAGNVATPETFTITVQDITIPVITFLGANPQTLEAATSYVELGATALDNIDGDISGSIIIVSSTVKMDTVGTYTVTYDVKDANNNNAVQVTRTVNVVDTTKPIITLIGANPQTYEVFGTYVEAGATASDNLDGDISGSIVTVSSAVKMDTVGTYTVTYNVKDANNNGATELTRTVNVVDTTKPTTSDDSVTAIKLPGYSVTITPVDNVDVASTKYCVDEINECNPTNDYNSAIVFEADRRGTNYLRYFSQDTAGNIQTVVSKIIKINQLPTQPAVNVGEIVYSGENITCEVISVSTDADSGDSVNYIYTWYKNGVNQTTYYGSTTIPSSETSKGEVWKCSVLATDGKEFSVTGENSVTVGALETHSITLTTSNTQLKADGSSTATITATLKDGANVNVLDGREVIMSTNKGSLSAVSGTTTSGQIQFTLTSAATVGTAIITVTSDGISQTKTVEFIPDSFGMIKLTSDKETAVADGIETIAFTAQIADANGNNIASSGETIEFETTAGLFSGSSTGSATTNINGQAVIVLTAPVGAASSATITASKGTTSQTKNIEFTSQTFDNTISLIGGKWNLISIPKRLADSSVGSLFSNSDKIYYYDVLVNDWKYIYMGSGELTTIDPLKSYWVKPSEDKTLTLTYETIGSGVPSLPPSQELVVGWNMIGQGSILTSTVSDALSSVDGKYAFVLEFNTETQEWKTYSVAGVKEFTTMKPGYGYWVFMKEAGIYASGA